ncbi:MAG TPA: serine hydrolase domain-containing protein [Streptosporangiaceae bacterium]|jgi:CubicO group peptidase (beta-lactamase class C family)
MSDQSRALPDQPSLRYLKLEAKRRLSAGEFATLHDAQLAIAREHGQPSWTALKQLVEAGPVLARARWVISRFAGAGGPGWAAPADAELREHFDEDYLRRVPATTMTRALTRVAEQLRGDLVVTTESPLGLRAEISGLRLEAAAQPAPPHRLTLLRLYPLGQRVTDPRVTAPPEATSGAVPAAAAQVAAEAWAELGLPGLVIAGAAGPGDGGWVAARGWACLERAEALRPGHRFPVYSITKLITSTAVLRLVADGRVGLDDAANRHLRTIALADEAVTIRELLAHTGGVASPGELFAGQVPSLVSLTGPVAACGGPRGTFAYSNGGYAMLGQLIADVTGTPYPDAAAALVLAPLGMTGSSFPASWPQDGAVTGYRVAGDGTFEPAPAQVSTLPAAAGLWSTAPDLVRFGLGWASLLPGGLAREAIRAHAVQRDGGPEAGLGWLLNRAKDASGQVGGGPASSSSLIVAPSTGRVSVTMTSRMVPIEPVNARLARSGG